MVWASRAPPRSVHGKILELTAFRRARFRITLVIFYPTPAAIIVNLVDSSVPNFSSNAAFEPQLRQRTAALRASKATTEERNRNMDRLELLISGPDPNLFRIVRAALED